MLDAFTFEVLRHRLEAIAREGAIALQRVSGSPLATEAFDLNTSIMSSAGEVAFVGPYLLTGPIGQGMIVRAILRDYADDPGIAPGDVYLCNDPYVGAAHQNCVTVVAPIHAGSRLIAWAGATLHVVDVGGPAAGQVGLGATSIFEEAPPIPPIRIVAGGRLQRDVEAEYLRRSRTPELNALDLRAKIAAVRTIADRLAAVVAEYGADAVVEVVAATIERATAHLERRIAELPREAVVQSAFVDHAEGGTTTFREVRLRLDAADGRLVFDFTGSATQAGAVVNCTRSGLTSGVVAGALTTLVWDWPWCPAAVERAIEIRSRPGTVVDAAWPAGCSMATMAAGFAATTVSAVGLARLLAGADALRDRAMAAWAGAVGSVDVFGHGRDGRPFGTVLLDSMASGTGARAWADGIDSGGFLRSISCVVSNVELYEARFPLLYLWRRHAPDSGGAGRQRGGAGVSYAVMPHGVERIPVVTPHFSGTVEPESAGLAGGMPGAPNAVSVVRSSGARRTMAAGRVPAGVEAFETAPEPAPGVSSFGLDADDVLVVAATGGGGWGDPLERSPEAVVLDLRAGLVSIEQARASYGVEPSPDGGVDAAATSALRAELRRRRAAELAVEVPTTAPSPGAPDGFRIDRRGDRPVVVCLGCDHALAVPDGRPPDAFPAVVRPFRPVPVTDDHEPSSFALAERYCPRCLRRVDVERIRLNPAEEGIGG